jgi:hypothetical protein
MPGTPSPLPELAAKEALVCSFLPNDITRILRGSRISRIAATCRVARVAAERPHFALQLLGMPEAAGEVADLPAAIDACVGDRLAQRVIVLSDRLDCAIRGVEPRRVFAEH